MTQTESPRQPDEVTRLEECTQALHILQKENSLLRKKVSELDKIAADLGKEYQKLQHAYDDLQWEKRMSGVSVKRCPSPAKKVLTALKKEQVEVPHTEHGDFQYHPKTIAQKAGISESTARRWLDWLEESQLLKRRYEASGKHVDKKGNPVVDMVYGVVDPRVINNPNNIFKIVPVDRKENRGGDRQPLVASCPTCGSEDTHLTGLCHNCGEAFFIDPERAERPVEEEPDDMAQQAEEILKREKDTLGVYSPDRPDIPCCFCEKVIWMKDKDDGWICSKCWSPISSTINNNRIDAEKEW